MKNFQFSIFNFQFQRGQALITLLFFALISLTITSAAVIIIMVNSSAIGKLQEGVLAYSAAESGIENALLHLLRDPNYTGVGETLTVDNASVIVTISPAGNSFPKTVTAIGTNGKFKRTVQAQMDYSNGYYTISNWKEL